MECNKNARTIATQLCIKLSYMLVIPADFDQWLKSMEKNL